MKYLIHGVIVGLMGFVAAQDVVQSDVIEDGGEVAVTAPMPVAKVPEVFRRVDVVTLAVPVALVTRQLIEDGSVTAERLVEHWKAGDAEMLSLQACNAGSQHECMAETTMRHRLLRKVRVLGTQEQYIDYDERETGSSLVMRITADASGERPEVELMVSAEYVIRVDPPNEDSDADIYYATASIRCGTRISLGADRYTLLGNSHQSSDKKTIVFLLARLGKPDAE
ncbi:MAG: hypothetical protein FWF84_00355 [Kiritimatiellaeota bacterium]|nr:hypothetical protein [Kiritimatiellota bacterium]